MDVILMPIEVMVFIFYSDEIAIDVKTSLYTLINIFMVP